MDGGEQTVLSLERQVTAARDEARMVLPGIQALFGFQLIAVFNERFDVGLTPHEKWVHLAATVLVAVSIALIMAPAAYHRQAERSLASQYFVNLASRLLCMAMFPLLLAIALEVFLVARLILHSFSVGIVLAVLLFVLFGWLWFVLPFYRSRRTTQRRPGRRLRQAGLP